MLQGFLSSIKAAQVRAVFLFDGSEAWLEEQRQGIQSRFPNITHISDRHNDATGMTRYRDYLGTSRANLLLDFTQQIHADALAALAGTVQGGGLIFILLPPHASHFKTRICRSVEPHKLISLVTPEYNFQVALRAVASEDLPKALPSELPSQRQLDIVEHMIDLPSTCHVILADRGRGKSTTLGLAAQAWLKNYRGRELVVTGPKPSSVQTLLEHADNQIRFVAWDRLLADFEPQSVRLIIDEAAAIPMHILHQLHARFTVWALASTVDGYEGCGRGFAIRFMDWLQEHEMCKVHDLDQPVRWSQHDTCEAWLNDLLILDTPATELDADTIDVQQLTISSKHASELNEHELASVIALLLEAHYQSSPNDLKLLLDDPEHLLLIARSNQQVVGVVWYSQEGELPQDIQPAILKGTRRLSGHILPQALAFYMQQPPLLEWRWWRITRIAVVKPMRRKGLGLQLLNKLQELAANAGVDALGSSFGASSEVLDFWSHSPFEMIRLGRKLNMASGYPNAIVALGLTEHSSRVLHYLYDYCQADIAWKQFESVAVTPSMHNIARAVLHGFAHGNLPFTEAQFAWSVCNLKQPVKNTGIILPGQILDAPEDLRMLAQNYGYSSQQTMHNQLRQLAREYLELTK